MKSPRRKEEPSPGWVSADTFAFKSPKFSGPVTRSRRASIMIGAQNTKILKDRRKTDYVPKTGGREVEKQNSPKQTNLSPEGASSKGTSKSAEVNNPPKIPKRRLRSKPSPQNSPIVEKGTNPKSRSAIEMGSMPKGKSIMLIDSGPKKRRRATMGPSSKASPSPDIPKRVGRPRKAESPKRSPVSRVRKISTRKEASSKDVRNQESPSPKGAKVTKRTRPKGTSETPKIRSSSIISLHSPAKTAKGSVVSNVLEKKNSKASDGKNKVSSPRTPQAISSPATISPGSNKKFAKRRESECFVKIEMLPISNKKASDVKTKSILNGSKENLSEPKDFVTPPDNAPPRTFQTEAPNEGRKRKSIQISSIVSFSDLTFSELSGDETEERIKRLRKRKSGLSSPVKSLVLSVKKQKIGEESTRIHWTNEKKKSVVLAGTSPTSKFQFRKTPASKSAKKMGTGLLSQKGNVAKTSTPQSRKRGVNQMEVRSLSVHTLQREAQVKGSPKVRKGADFSAGKLPSPIKTPKRRLDLTNTPLSETKIKKSTDKETSLREDISDYNIREEDISNEYTEELEYASYSSDDAKDFSKSGEGHSSYSFSGNSSDDAGGDYRSNNATAIPKNLKFMSEYSLLSEDETVIEVRDVEEPSGWKGWISGCEIM